MSKPAPKPHAMIAALFAELGPPGQGAFPLERRLAWLRMAAMAFDLAYGVDAPIEIALAGVPRVIGFSEVDVRAIAAEEPVGGRVVSLDSMRQATRSDGVYAAAKLGKARAPDQKYLIDLDGVAFGPLGQVDPDHIPAGEMIWDFRSVGKAGAPIEPGLGAVIWASGRFDEQALPPLIVMRG